MRKYSLR